MKSVRVSMIVVVAMGLTACGMFGEGGTFRDRSRDYLKSEEVPPLQLPEGIKAEALGDIYVVPPVPETSLIDESV